MGLSPADKDSDAKLSLSLSVLRYGKLNTTRGSSLMSSPRATSAVDPPYMFAEQLTQVCGAGGSIYVGEEHCSFSRGLLQVLRPGLWQTTALLVS